MTNDKVTNLVPQAEAGEQILILPRLHHVPDELARQLLCDLDEVLANGFGRVTVEVANGNADVIPAPRYRYKF